ncbi:hypothetical protein EDB80DRAFT_402880 [Ilyonectria destructans]|nr:hypothetical protein EDB80DRAFT_402880 [Ilyonectria destructans]
MGRTWHWISCLFPRHDFFAFYVRLSRAVAFLLALFFQEAVSGQLGRDDVCFFTHASSCSPACLSCADRKRGDLEAVRIMFLSIVNRVGSLGVLSNRQCE